MLSVKIKNIFSGLSKKIFKKSNTLAISIVLGLVFLFLLTYKESRYNAGLYARKSELLRKIELEKAKAINYKLQAEYYKSEEYLQKMAKSRLNKVESGEKVLIIKD
jgi:cell division protein FtsB